MNVLNRLIPIVLLLAVTALLGTGCSKAAKAHRHQTRAEKYFAAGEYERAGIEYRNVLRYNPTNHAVVLRLARIMCEQGSPIRAMQTLNEYGLKPEDPVLRFKLAEMHLSNGDRVLARSELLALLNQNPTNTDALLLLSAAASESAEMADMAARLQRLAQQQPNCAAVYLAQANLLMRQKNFPAAEQLVQRALQLTPALPQAHLGQAQLYLLRSNYVAAEQSFAAAMKTAPIRSPIRLAYARAKAGAGKLDEARTVLNEIIKKAPDYLPASLFLARIELGEKKPDPALTLTERILARDPINLEARLVRSQAFLAKKQPDKAAAEWERFDQQIRPNPWVKLQLAKAYAANREARAGTLLDQVIVLSSNRLDNTALEAHLMKARLDMALNPPAAIDALNKLIKRTNILEARLLLADTYRTSRRLPEAVAILRDLAKEAPKNSRFPLLIGLMLREQGETAAARTALQQSLQLNPDNAMALFQLVDLEIDTTNQPAALRLVQAQAAKRTNAVAALKFLEGRIYASQKQWPQAETVLRAAIDADPNFSSPYHLLSSVYLARTNLAGAAKELENFARHTNDVRSLMMLGTIRGEMGEHAKAAETYEKLLTISPQFVPALNNLAYVYCERLNDLDKAAELARKARQIAPHDAAIADTLGWILHKQGDNQGALPLLHEAAENFSGNPEIQYHLGTVYYMLNQRESAKTALQRALVSKVAFPGKDQAKVYLDRITGSVVGASAATVAELEKAIKTQPADLTARMQLAGLYEQAAQAEKAAAEYQEVLRQNPRSAPAALRLALLYAGPLNNRAKSVEFAQKTRDLAPNEPESGALLGKFVYQDGNHAQAYSLLLPSAQQLPNRADIQYDLAWAAWSVGRVAEADQALRRCLQVDPKFAQANAARSFAAMIALQLNPQGLPQAEPQIQQALKADPALAPAQISQAMLFRVSGNAKEASALFEKVSARFPAFAPAKRELAFLYAADPNQAQKAFDLFLKVREAYPEDTEVARTLAILSYQRKDYRYAIPLLQTSLRTKPNDPEATFYLGMSLCQTKDLVRGREQLQKAVADGLKEPMLTEAKRMLASGSGK